MLTESSYKIGFNSNNKTIEIISDFSSLGDFNRLLLNNNRYSKTGRTLSPSVRTDSTLQQSLIQILENKNSEVFVSGFVQHIIHTIKWSKSPFKLLAEHSFEYFSKPHEDTITGRTDFTICNRKNKNVFVNWELKRHSYSYFSIYDDFLQCVSQIIGKMFSILNLFLRTGLSKVLFSVVELIFFEVRGGEIFLQNLNSRWIS